MIDDLFDLVSPKMALRQKIGFLVFLLLTTTIAEHKVLGSHSVGADLTYKCLGGDDYLIRLAFYRDCAGIASPGSPVINIKSVVPPAGHGVRHGH